MGVNNCVDNVRQNCGKFFLIVAKDKKRAEPQSIVINFGPASSCPKMGCVIVTSITSCRCSSRDSTSPCTAFEAALVSVHSLDQRTSSGRR
jgi:hypothetical protein